MEIVSDQGVHFINKVIRLLTSKHMISHMIREGDKVLV